MKKFFRQIKYLFIDIKNRKKFKQEITLELEDPASKMNGFEITSNSNFTRLSSIVSIPDEFQLSGTEIDKLNKLKELVKPMTNYICFELGWAEYILVPEFFYLDDPIQPNMSRSYLVIWQYKPLVLDDTGFWLKIITSIISIIGIAIAATICIL